MKNFINGWQNKSRNQVRKPKKRMIRIISIKAPKRGKINPLALGLKVFLNKALKRELALV
jgi:hypothetical protein